MKAQEQKKQLNGTKILHLINTKHNELVNTFVLEYANPLPSRNLAIEEAIIANSTAQLLILKIAREAPVKCMNPKQPT